MKPRDQSAKVFLQTTVGMGEFVNLVSISIEFIRQTGNEIIL
jgi:hypothetical protein